MHGAISYMLGMVTMQTKLDKSGLAWSTDIPAVLMQGVEDQDGTEQTMMENYEEGESF